MLTQFVSPKRRAIVPLSGMFWSGKRVAHRRL
jgi:hypothetical protein